MGTGNSNPDVLSAEEVYLVEFEMFTPNMQQLEEEADMAYKQFGYQLEQFKQGKKIKTSQLWYFLRDFYVQVSQNVQMYKLIFQKIIFNSEKKCFDSLPFFLSSSFFSPAYIIIFPSSIFLLNYYQLSFICYYFLLHTGCFQKLSFLVHEFDSQVYNMLSRLEDGGKPEEKVLQDSVINDMLRSTLDQVDTLDNQCSSTPLFEGFMEGGEGKDKNIYIYKESILE